MAKFILMGIDECGDEFHVKDYQLPTETMDRESVEFWKDIKLSKARAEGNPEIYGYFWIEEEYSCEGELSPSERRYENWLKENYDIDSDDFDEEEAWEEYTNECDEARMMGWW